MFEPLSNREYNGTDTHSREATMYNCFSEKWSTLKEQNLLQLGSTIFSFRYISFSEGALCAGKQKVSREKLSPLYEFT